VRYSKLIAAIAGLALSILSVGAANAGERSPFMSFRERTPPPVGFIVFCAVNPHECFGDAPPSAGLTPSSPSITAALSNRAPAPVEPLLHKATLGGRWVQVRELPVLARAKVPALIEGPAAFAQMEAPTPPASGAIVLDRSTLELLKTVNTGVNRRVRARSDLQISGLVEQWSLPYEQDGELFGDCEDYALLKRHELIAQGVPRAALSMAVAQTRYGETHAVLVVSTDQGDMVLDNLSSQLKTWSATGYKWMSRQVAGDSNAWVDLGGVQG
jgi:predicted transglutaminase-like cysteine proteinase